MSWRIQSVDPDVQAYILAVEQADGQQLEQGVRGAINNFVVGCKADGIWDAIKASCIMAGARTRLGAMVPLKGTAPTSFNFVDGDYNRTTGLVGNGSTKYLDSNRNTDADPLDNFHISAYQSSLATAASILIGSNATINSTSTLLFALPSGSNVTGRSRSPVSQTIAVLSAPGLVGQSRASSSSWVLRGSGTSGTITQASTAGANSLPLFVYGQNLNGSVASYITARIAFYSIGESLDLALLDARVTALINEYGALDI